MRQITYKRYTPALPRITWYGPTIVQADGAIVRHDMSTVRQFGHEVITITVPYQFEVIHRYLRTFFPQFKVHDYALSQDSWGWYLNVNDTALGIRCNASAVFMASTEPTLSIPYKNRKQKRIALKFVLSMLQTHAELQEQGKKRK